MAVVVAEEMDWDKSGMVNFKEFLFAFTRWVGIEDNEDEDAQENAWFINFGNLLFIIPICLLNKDPQKRRLEL